MFKIKKSVKSYVVVGETGEYADWSSWIVCFCGTKLDAEKICKFLTAKCKMIGLDVRRPTVTDDKIIEMRKFDPTFQIDYTGSSYRVKEIYNGIWLS